MSKIFTVGEGGLPLIPEGEYKASFKSYEEKTGLAYGDAIRMDFEIIEDEFKDIVVNTLVSMKLSPQSRFGRAVSALTKRPLKPKEDIDLDALIGDSCVVVVRTVEGKGSYGDFSAVAEVKALPEDLPF